MNRKLLYALALSVAGTVSVPALTAATLTVGTINYDLTTPPGAAQFDIVNYTGPNASPAPDTTFPVTTSVSLSNLSLTVGFASGPSETFGSSYFTLAPDRLSFDGTALSTGIGQPSGLAGATSAVLTGAFSTTSFVLNDGTTVTVDPTFSATISDTGGLTDGDFGLITATTSGSGGGGGGGTGVTPEPETFALVGTGIAALAGLRRRSWLTMARKLVSRSSLGSLTVLLFAGVLLASSVEAQGTTVKLNAWTSPSSGATGSTFVNVSGSGFPSGTISPSFVVVSLSTSCAGPGATKTTPNSVSPIIGTSDRIHFQIPALLPAGTYFVSVSGTSSSGTSFSSGNCSEIQVTHTSSALAACLPSSSLAVLSGTTVTAYVPNGWWGGSLTGVEVVPVEGPGAVATIATPSVVNSCSSNSQTKETVCVANNKDVYEITGSVLNTTLQSGSNSAAGFSGGECENCGVAIDALTNTAVISMGATGGNSGDGLQLLNLANNSFAPVFPTDSRISEDVSIDPNRNLILSPGETNIYDLFKISSTGALTEFEHPVSAPGEMDSAAEDCTTGIALSSIEGSGDLYITDLTQATFTDPVGGSNHGTWTAPEQVVNFPEFDYFSAGTDGISVAAGTTHLGIVSGEFGGATFGAFQLPATSGVGTPSFVDYVAATMPNTPDGNYFSAGYDPHTITAYTSPNNGKAYGLLVDWATGRPNYVGVIDLQALLTAPRQAGSHNVNPAYDLVAHGVVRYIAIP